MRIKFKRYGHKGMLVQWPKEVNTKCLQEMQTFVLHVKEFYSDIKTIYHAYHEVYIEFTKATTDYEGYVMHLQFLYQGLTNQAKKKETTWVIPTCYSSGLVPDLEIYLAKKNLDIESFIELHTSILYTVYFTGFLPGFLYLGGLPESLAINRKLVPSKNIKRGTVAIGGQQTGIYPQDSPGGWYGVGYTPISFFDPNNTKRPTWAKSGDQVKFKTISLSELEVLEREIAEGQFTFQTDIHEG